jgi:4-amino-4-deoxy-L-arabinose transferase-like glycosyltransferase
MVTAAAGVPTDSATSRRSPRLAWAALLAIFVAVYIGAIFSPALLDDADATHAEAAREMAASGDWVTLHINGVRYLEKAPLMYWISAVSFKTFGVSAAAARVPIVLGIFGLALLAGVWGRRAFGEVAGIYGALFVLTATGIFLFTRILIPEVLLTLFIGGALYFFLTGLEDRRASRIYAGYAATALAVLTKGLVALAFVGGTAVVYLAMSGDWRRWREFRLATGLVLLFAIAAPWHILATFRNPGFFWFYFINEHFLRFLGQRWPKDYNKMPAVAYWTAHLAWLFPWSLFAPLVVRDALRREDDGVRWIELWWKRPRPLNFQDRTRLLCLVWAGLILLFFAFSTNQEYYTFPAYLPLLMLVARSLTSSQNARGARRWVVGAYTVLLVVGCAASAALVSGLWSSRNLPFVPDIGEVLVQRGVGNYTLSMSHFFDLTDASFAALRLPAAIAAVALVVGPLAGVWFSLKQKNYAAIWSVALGMAGLLIAAHIALVRFEPYLSSRALASRIAAVEQPGDRVMIYGDQAFGSSLLFYLRQPVELVNGRSTSMAFGSTYPDAPKIFLTGADLERAWMGPRRVFLFVPEDKRAQAEKLIPQRKVFAEMSGKAVYSNR